MSFFYLWGPALGPVINRLSSIDRHQSYAPLDERLHRRRARRRLALRIAAPTETGSVNAKPMLRPILDKLSGIYIGWRMIGVSCAIRVLGGWTARLWTVCAFFSR